MPKKRKPNIGPYTGIRPIGFGMGSIPRDKNMKNYSKQMEYKKRTYKPEHDYAEKKKE